MSTTITSAEIEFKKRYISSNEICEHLQITASGLSRAVERGNFVPPMNVDSNIRLWDRAEVEPLLKAWKARLSKATRD